MKVPTNVELRNAEHESWATAETQQADRVAQENGTCPGTGRSASVCDTPDHRNCPDLRTGEETR